MSDRSFGPPAAGLLGPVALYGGLLLLLAAPLMRGGNRHIVLIPLEILGLFVLVALAVRRALRPHQPAGPVHSRFALPFLLLAPAFLALAHLLPLPADLWSRMAGRAVYAEALQEIGIPAAAWRPLSISPDATAASLLAGIPVAAAFLMGFGASTSQLRVIMRLVVALAFAQVLLGLLQISGGLHSPLYFGLMTYGAPVGTFANRNHYANYLAMALVAYIWLAYEAHRHARNRHQPHSFGTPQRAGAWVAGGLVLVLGILMSRSRGGAVFGLSAAVVAFGVVSLRLGGWSRGLRFAVPTALVLVTASAILIGFEAVTERISSDQLASSAGFRGALARTSLDAAIAFWPWGSGWGTYDLAYQRFQPPTLPGYANHAHMDYVEMLLEGGIFFVALAAAVLWLVVRRAHLLLKHAVRERRVGADSMAATLCGVGLLGLLLHSLVEFNLRIPANAILGALLAGVFLRPLGADRVAHDRPAQPHPSRD